MEINKLEELIKNLDDLIVHLDEILENFDQYLIACYELNELIIQTNNKQERMEKKSIIHEKQKKFFHEYFRILSLNTSLKRVPIFIETSESLYSNIHNSILSILKTLDEEYKDELSFQKYMDEKNESYPTTNNQDPPFWGETATKIANAKIQIDGLIKKKLNTMKEKMGDNS